jgi:hypothetical protein
MQFIMDYVQRAVILEIRDSVLGFYDRSVLHKEVAIARQIASPLPFFCF